MINNTLEDMTYFLNEVGRDITINSTNVKAIIKSLSQGDFDDKQVSTFYPIKRGDIVSFEGLDYLIVTESVSKKPLMYKAEMRNINHTILIKGEPIVTEYDKFGRPIAWEDGEDITYHCIIDTQKFTIADGAIRVSTGEIVITIPNNEEYLTQFALNKTVDVAGGTYKVINHDLTKNGLIFLTCEKTV